MKQNIKQVLKQQIELIKLDKEKLKKIDKISKTFVKDLQEKLNKKKITAQVFIGGSLAKKTIVKKDKYDVDLFIRFSDISQINVLDKFLKKAKKIHGSRDYYQLNIEGILLEVVPVLKVNKPEKAVNVTDLSYFHVKYVTNQIKKNKNLANEILLAKSFCHAKNCYGAESYIKGFSGYSLELLICHYQSFEKFLKAIIKVDKNQLIIDDKKFYKSSIGILKELNESKIKSPIIVVDPTFKQRNVCAGLSHETFYKFQQKTREFLKNPTMKSFEKENIEDKLRKKYKDKLKIIKIKTNKQQGDISGTKSRKFFDFLNYILKKEFLIKEKEFFYDEKKNLANFYYVLDKKNDELVSGPKLSDKKNLLRFKKAHKKIIIKKNNVYVKVSHNLSLEEFLKKFKNKSRKIIKEMNIKELKLI